MPDPFIVRERGQNVPGLGPHFPHFDQGAGGTQAKQEQDRLTEDQIIAVLGAMGAAEQSDLSTSTYSDYLVEPGDHAVMSRFGKVGDLINPDIHPTVREGLIEKPPSSLFRIGIPKDHPKLLASHGSEGPRKIVNEHLADVQITLRVDHDQSIALGRQLPSQGCLSHPALADAQVHPSRLFLLVSHKPSSLY